MRILFLLVFLITVSTSEEAQAADPMTALSQYETALLVGNQKGAFALMTADSMNMFKGQPANPSRMQNEAGYIAKCKAAGKTQVKGLTAVIVFPKDRTDCTPYFLAKEQGQWKLDFATMSRVIRFDGGNNWWIDPKQNNPYGFAFKN